MIGLVPWCVTQHSKYVYPVAQLMRILRLLFPSISFSHVCRKCFLKAGQMADADIVQSFNSGIEPGLHTPYTQVHVLLIHWEVNDLEGVEDEVQKLRDVFRTKYNYNSVIFRIPTDKSCRIRLNKEILGFVENQSQRDGLIIVYYAGHCGPGDHGQAEWAAFEDQKQPKLSWNEGQQLLFSAPGDVLLILDCCNASLIALGSKDEGSRFELIAASAKDGKTPVPGTKSFTTTLTKLLKLHADEGISSENLSSELREHRKITGMYRLPIWVLVEYVLTFEIARNARLSQFRAEIPNQHSTATLE